MALSVQVATKIVDAVVKSSASRKLIDSPLGKILPDRLGIAGTLRNIGFMLTGRDSIDPDVASKVCTGIAGSTYLDIAAAKIEGVKKADVITRMGPDHDATLVVMEDGTEYVFDWHSTLQSSNPTIYKKRDWQKNTGGCSFSSFKGFE